MTSSTPAAQHDPSPYLEQTHDSYAVWAAETFTAAAAEHGIVLLTGACPQCRGDVEIVLVNTIFAGRNRPGGWLRPGGSADPSSARLFMCTCPLEHPDRPQGYSGCGAYWKLTIEAAAG